LQIHGIPSKNIVVMPAHSGIKFSFQFRMPAFVKCGRCEPENKEIDFEALTKGDICFSAA
jgi:hypothetical protein